MRDVMRELVEQVSPPQAEEERHRPRPGAEDAQKEQEKERARDRARREANEVRAHHLRGLVVNPVSEIEERAHPRRSRSNVKRAMDGILHNGPEQEAQNGEPKELRPCCKLMPEGHSAQNNPPTGVDEKRPEVRTAHAEPSE